MNNDLDRRVLLGAAGFAGVAAIACAGRAGPLNPPAGAVASTAKPLSEVEPRIAVNATNTPGNANVEFFLSTPGSYYLASSVSSSKPTTIAITTNGVTLDLNGFTVSNINGATTSAALSLNGYNVTVRNGHVSSGGRGIYGSVIGAPVTIDSVAVTAVSVGIYNTGPSTVTGCTVSQSGAVTTFDGISGDTNSQVRACTVLMNTGITTPTANKGVVVGANSLVESCIVQAGGIGVSMADGVVRNCRVQDQNNAGVRINGGICENNSIANVTVIGIGCVATEVRGNRIAGNSTSNAIGVYLTGSNNTVAKNTITNFGGTNGYGVSTFSSFNVGANKIMDNELINVWRPFNITAPYNLIVRNTMSFVGGGGNAYFAALNSYGPVVNAGNGDLSAVPGTSHPQANIVY